MKFLGALMVLGPGPRPWLLRMADKLDWKSKEDDPQLALADAKTRSRPAPDFPHQQGAASTAAMLSDGAFSDPPSSKPRSPLSASSWNATGASKRRAGRRFRSRAIRSS